MEREDTKKQEAERKYSGVAVDIANDDKVNEKMVDEETKTLNLNPRNEA